MWYLKFSVLLYNLFNSIYTNVRFSLTWLLNKLFSFFPVRIFRHQEVLVFISMTTAIGRQLRNLKILCTTLLQNKLLESLWSLRWFYICVIIIWLKDMHLPLDKSPWQSLPGHFPPYQKYFLWGGGGACPPHGGGGNVQGDLPMGALSGGDVLGGEMS